MELEKFSGDYITRFADNVTHILFPLLPFAILKSQKGDLRKVSDYVPKSNVP